MKEFTTVIRLSLILILLVVVVMMYKKKHMVPTPTPVPAPTPEPVKVVTVYREVPIYRNVTIPVPMFRSGGFIRRDGDHFYR